MAFLFEKNNNTITVTGYQGEVGDLQIPEELDGLPVRRIAHSAFANRSDLAYVSLPSSLRCLERFAFYSCRNLKRVSLSDGITDYYDGAFRQCRGLKEIELDLRGGNYMLLRDFLADSDAILRFRIRLPEGSAALTFPDYVAEYEEDTRARALHLHIEGMGYAFRECVTRSGIDFRGYDRLFDRIRYIDRQLAAQIAMDRLCLPAGLGSEAGKGMEEFLREEGETAIGLVFKEEQREWLCLLTERRLLSAEAMQAGLRLAAEQKKTEMAAILMNASAEETAGSGKNVFCL